MLITKIVPFRQPQGEWHNWNACNTHLRKVGNEEQ